jgi:hypothetical protein
MAAPDSLPRAITAEEAGMGIWENLVTLVSLLPAIAATPVVNDVKGWQDVTSIFVKALKSQAFNLGGSQIISREQPL